MVIFEYLFSEDHIKSVMNVMLSIYDKCGPVIQLKYITPEALMDKTFFLTYRGNTDLDQLYKLSQRGLIKYF